jgi:hypothetical protein
MGKLHFRRRRSYWLAADFSRFAIATRIHKNHRGTCFIAFKLM